MKRYIEKDRILAEIDKRMEELRPTNTHKMQTGEKVDRDVLMWLNALTWVKKFLNTLEVKEVDLVGQLNSFQNFYAHENAGEFPSAIEIAKHFFELGLKTQKGE